jgi:predicted metalloprotease with PDZ domain
LAVKYIDKKVKFKRNSIKVLDVIKTIISQDNIDRFKNKIIVKDLWEAIISIYGETNLEIIARYFNKIIEINYNLFKNTDKYTNYIQSIALYLKKLGHALPEPFIVILLFKGLSNSFDLFNS